jgi:hypothetical protein
MQLGEGAKGVLWFRYMTPDNMERTYRDDFKKWAKRLEELKQRGELRDWMKGWEFSESDLEAAFTQYRKFWAETWAAMKEMNTEMCLLRPLLSRGDVYPQVWVESASNRRKLYLSSIASHRGVVLFAVNLDYDLHPKGYRFRPQKNVLIAVETPAWLSVVESAWIVRGEQMVPIGIQKNGGNIAVELDSLQDGAIVLMGEKGLAGSLKPNTKSLMP